ncbi:sugar transferase, partial [Bosea thiooxidans]
MERFDRPHIVHTGSLTSLRLTRQPLSPVEVTAKRAFDIAAATCALVLTLPLLLAIAALIRLDSPGPVLFRQRRYGFNQQAFRIYKFRTMTSTDDGPVIVQAKRDDPRITRIGRVLRRFNLDELPQLLNVLSGDMSLVGPRPHALAHDVAFQRRIANYARRHNVKPGITGWASAQRPARRDRYGREDGPAHRLRSLVHRELVVLARYRDPVADRSQPPRLHERTLSRPATRERPPHPRSSWPIYTSRLAAKAKAVRMAAITRARRRPAP